jgi:hypothetical protein
MSVPHFPRKLGQRWREAVRHDAQRQGDALEGEAFFPESLLTRYGTTLLVALIVPDAVLIGQIGDGDVLLVNLVDDTCDLLLRRPDTLLGTSTYSLCSSDATHLWQTAVIEHPPTGLLLLATDGLADAMGADDATLSGFAHSLGQRRQKFGPLAVLLFNLWIRHHPLHGELEYNIRFWDLVAKRHVYGERPVFVCDPQDHSNQLPHDPDYASARRL